MDFSSHTPLIKQLIPTIDSGLVIHLKRSGHLIVVFYAFRQYLQKPIISVLKFIMSFISFFHKFIPLAIITKDSTLRGFYFGGEVTNKEINADTNVFNYLIITCIIILPFFFTIDGPLYWMVYPIVKMVRAITIWFEIGFGVKIIFITLFKSFSYLLWGLFLFPIWLMIICIPLKTISLTASRMKEHLSVDTYNFIVGLIMIYGAIIIFITS